MPHTHTHTHPSTSSESQLRSHQLPTLRARLEGAKRVLWCSFATWTSRIGRDPLQTNVVQHQLPPLRARLKGPKRVLCGVRSPRGRLALVKTRFKPTWFGINYLLFVLVSRVQRGFSVVFVHHVDVLHWSRPASNQCGTAGGLPLASRYCQLPPQPPSQLSIDKCRSWAYNIFFLALVLPTNSSTFATW